MTTESTAIETNPSIGVGTALKNITVWSTLAAALGYFMAYLYELGYFSAFGIPQDLIILGSTQILAIVLKILGSAFTIFWVIFIIFSIVMGGKLRFGPIVRRLFLMCIFLGIYIAFAISYPRAFKEWYYVIPMLMYWGFILFIVPWWITQKRVSGYRNRLIAQDQIDKKDPYVDYIWKYLGSRVATLLLLVIPLVLVAALLGEAAATKTVDYWIPSTHPNSVVLRMYGEKLICGEVDTTSHKLNGNLFMINMTYEPKTMLRIQRLDKPVTLK